MAKLWSRSRRVRGLVLLLAAIFGGVVLANQLAEARPGGGQNYRAPSRSYSAPSRSYSAPSRSYSAPSRSYSSGSSSSYSAPVYVPPSSGSSSGSSYSGSSSGYQRSGCGSAGWIAVLIIVLVLLYIYYSSQKKGEQQPQRARIVADQTTAELGIDAIRNQDPEFDPKAFLERTRAVVAKVNETWLAGDMKPARRVISDGVFVRFSTQLELLKADGLRNAMADWRIVSAEILSAEVDPLWDTVHVKIACAARDSDVALNLSEAQAKKKLAGAPLEEYHEVWSFVRRRGKHSKKGVPALEGRCPNCGAEMPLSEVVKCEYCQALVNSGEHDWVLAEITQPEEWRPSATLDSIAGLEALRERDPAVSRQELEDRASVVFWKWIEARSTAKPEKLARFCMKPPQGERDGQNLGIGTTATKLRQVAVGSAELKAMSPSNDGALNHATVEIRWSGSVDGAESAFDVHLFVLARKAEAQSKRGMSSLDCPVCGGQLASSDAPTCSYCGEKLFGGKHEWALLAVKQGHLPPEDKSESEPQNYEYDEDEPPPSASSPVSAAGVAIGVGLGVLGAILDHTDTSTDSDDD